ncbi:MAG: phosphatidylethanolamine/phosphatidyl-N-methylethanolamine N-methyltransferase [Vicingaceae bacterium]|jgi:phosphatidylethanolamine/phosphatidyl-N-methylethanolamine N-methyltransferase
MKTSQFYNTISPLYFIIDFFLKGHKNLLIQEVNKYPNHSILEIGVGQGKHLKEYHSVQITGIDLSKKMLQQARKNNPNSIKLMNMDAIDFAQLDQKFDLVVLSHVLSTSSKANEILHASNNILNTNGKIIILNHFSNNGVFGVFEKIFQPIARLLHFQSYFPLKNLKALKAFRPVKALKFGILNSYQLLIFEKT